MLSHRFAKTADDRLLANNRWHLNSLSSVARGARIIAGTSRASAVMARGAKTAGTSTASAVIDGARRESRWHLNSPSSDGARREDRRLLGLHRC